MNMENILRSALGGIAGDAINSIISAMASVGLLLAIPMLVMGIAYCFFGIRAYRVLIAIESAISGGIAGAIVFLLLFADGSASIGAFFGFLLFTAIFGLLAWYACKIFVVIHALMTGVVNVTFMLFMMTSSLVGPLVIGLIIGIILAVLTTRNLKIMIMGVTAYKGGETLALIMMLLVLSSSGNMESAGIWFWLFLIACTIGGFYVQNYFDRKKPCSLEILSDWTNFPQSVQQSVKKPVQTFGGKLIGIEGMYKQTEFNLDGRTVMGRDAKQCNIVFPAGTKGISKIQCEIHWSGQTKTCSIVDNGSTYGTMVNGVKLTNGQPQRLNAGDMISVGENNVFRVQC